jgi:hypothetical protein
MTAGREVEVRLAPDSALAVVQPVQLVGAGSLLVGELIASGDGPGSIRLHPTLVFPLGGGEAAFPVRPVIFWPGRQRSVRLQVGISPSIGPGRYAAELRLGNSAVPADVLVAESHDLTVLPNPVAVPNQPGSAVPVDVVCRNDGNVPAFVGSIGPVRVAGRRGFGPRRDRSDEQDVDEREPSAFLEVEVLGDDEWVQPGRAESLRWAVTVPEGLAPGTLYGGVAPLSSTPVSFLVIPAPSAPRQRRTGRQPRSSGPGRSGPRQRTSSSAAARPGRATEPPSA